ncbi:ATP-dependent RNA helicase DeaD [Symbiobacterium terraclitae]|uniref:RNA helicase n=1 Tax=Symbiobacterium terraclitae TaxID=557451 RepID=A0ABS4JMW8_9FIRM|nr:DEAD/DEAH box helicase [Symbiobacterium terraclitae]MBP2016883.1 ATP-dependent RNA helicase DeaD [Symbiobacterium terraclitae]
MAETKLTFRDLELSEKVLKALDDMGFEEPSPIQEQAIPSLLQGRDVIGQAQTGTGKTAAFGVPIVERWDPKLRAVQAIVLTPTRELAIQVAEEITKIGKYARVKTIAIYGGQSIERQIRSLRFGVDVVIGTPGRILDHLGRGTLDLSQVRIVVLDEADEMLDMGFIDDIEKILQATPAERQTLLFSATMPPEIRRLAGRYMRDPITISVTPQQLTVPQIDQYFYEVRPSFKTEALTRILDIENVERGICFCRTKKGVDELVEALQARGYQAEGIHGDMNQAQRNRVMSRFREGYIELLVATDVAARGLDISDVTHVFNYDIPQDPESYVHRIGRTGRAGRTGTAVTLVTPREFPQLRLIERVIKTRLQRRPVPSLTDVAEKQREQLKEKLIKVLEENQLGEFKQMAEDLMAEYDPSDLVAAALKLVSGEGKPSQAAAQTDFGDTGAEAGMVRFFLNVGRAQSIQPADIVRTIAQEANIPGSVIGLINIYDRFTFVEVPKDVAGQVMQAMQGATIRGYQVNIEPAKPR